MSDDVASVHQRLRLETKALHEDLENAVDIAQLITSRPLYAGYLSRLWRVHKAVELRFCPIDFSPFGFDYRQRRRSLQLEADLAALGYPASTLQVDSLPNAPAVASTTAALGAIYVVEGSALGARAILPDIKAALGLDESHGASFFVGLGKDGKAIWQACLAGLNSLEPSSAHADAVVDSAKATFAMFRQHLPATDKQRPQEALLFPAEG